MMSLRNTTLEDAQKKIGTLEMAEIVTEFIHTRHRQFRVPWLLYLQLNVLNEPVCLSGNSDGLFAVGSTWKEHPEKRMNIYLDVYIISSSFYLRTLVISNFRWQYNWKSVLPSKISSGWCSVINAYTVQRLWSTESIGVQYRINH